MNKRFALLLILILLPFCAIMASSMGPMLWGLHIWEYYKYENGNYRNYALVINSQDTDIEVTIAKWTGSYSDRPTQQSEVSTKPIMPISKHITSADDTLISGLKLKRHEIRVIPDLFENYRRRHKSCEVSVYTNGIKAGRYVVQLPKLPDNLPKSIIISCFQMNGEISPVIMLMHDTMIRRKKSYEMQLQCEPYFQPSGTDTIDLSAPNYPSLIKSFGLTALQLELLDIDFRKDLIQYHYDKNRKGKEKLLNTTFQRSSLTEKIKIKTADTKSPSFTYFQVRYRSNMSQVLVIPIPVNIRL